jgi:hypothetical protein
MTHFLLKRDYKDNWEKENPIIHQGEMIFVIDLNAVKVGIGKKYKDTDFIDSEVYINGLYIYKELGQIKADLASDLTEFLKKTREESLNRNFYTRYEEIQEIFSKYNFKSLNIETIKEENVIIKLIDTSATNETGKKISFNFKVIDNKIVGCSFKNVNLNKSGGYYDNL